MITVALVVLDAVALIVAFVVAYVIRFKAGLPFLDTPQYSGAVYSVVAAWTVPIWLLIFAAYRLYDRRILLGGCQETTQVLQACTTGLLAEIVLSFLDPNVPISRGWLLLTWLVSSIAVAATRLAERRGLRALRRRGIFKVPALIVGTNAEALALAERLRADPAAGPELIGFIDNVATPGAAIVDDLRVFGPLESVGDFVRRLHVGEVIVASTAVTRDELLDLYRTLGQDQLVELRLSSGLFEILNTGMLVQEINGVPLMTPNRVRITGADAVFKTAIDYVIATAALVILSPLMLMICALVKLDSRGPAIYRRRVLGVSGKRFDALKFRTMIVGAERRHRQQPIGFADRRKVLKAKRDPRVTRVGRFLRRTSLDELPQLINVLRGEMSLVGPRMIAPDEAARYGKWQFNLATVKPGITGPWQVRGRGDIPYEERVRLSMQYIRNYSIWLDIEILFRTVFVVLLGRGAY